MAEATAGVRPRTVLLGKPRDYARVRRLPRAFREDRFEATVAVVSLIKAWDSKVSISRVWLTELTLGNDAMALENCASVLPSDSINRAGRRTFKSISMAITSSNQSNRSSCGLRRRRAPSVVLDGALP